MMKSSLFDNDSKKLLFQKIGHKNKLNSFVYFEGEFYHENKFKMKLKYYYFSEYYLFRSSSKSKIKLKNFMNYKNVLVEFFTGPKSTPLGIKFIKNGKFYEILTKNEELYEKCKEFLRNKCILNTFHEDFIVKNVIGKGNFAKVYCAVQKESDKEFAIKAFSKEDLLNQKNGKVIFIIFQ